MENVLSIMKNVKLVSQSFVDYNKKIILILGLIYYFLLSV